jgi:hypothetical protein
MSKRFIYYGSFASVQFFSDLFGMPTAAYALIKLTPNATNCIRVRRSSDNAEQDIGFVANVPDSPIDTTALLAFVGAGNGFVVTKYDQSTNNNHATNSTGSTQPQIVSSGSLVTESGLPAYNVTGKLLQLPAGMITGSSNRSLFSIVKASATNATVGGNTTINLVADASGGVGSNWNVCMETSALFVRVIGNASFSYPTGKSSTDYSLVSTIFNQTTVNQVLNWQNGVTMPFVSGTGATINTIATTTGRISIYSSTTVTFTGNHLAHILYNTDKTSQRAAIETYLDNYYNVL